MKKNIIIIILAVLIIGLGSFIVYDKVLKEEPKQEEKKEQEKISVYSGYSYHEKIEGVECENAKIDVEIPQIKSDKENARILNEKIMKIYDYGMKKDKDFEVSISYNYVVKNEYIFITVSSRYASVCNPGGAHRIMNFYYDIANDKILNTKEAYEMIGLSENILYDITDKHSLTDEQIQKHTSFEGCDDSNENWGCGCGIKVDDNKRLIPFNNMQCD